MTGIVFDILFFSKELEDNSGLKANDAVRSLALKLKFPDYTVSLGNRSHEKYEHSTLFSYVFAMAIAESISP